MKITNTGYKSARGNLAKSAAKTNYSAPALIIKRASTGSNKRRLVKAAPTALLMLIAPAAVERFSGLRTARPLKSAIHLPVVWNFKKSDTNPLCPIYRPGAFRLGPRYQMTYDKLSPAKTTAVKN